jgi:hypothetical protein
MNFSSATATKNQFPVGMRANWRAQMSKASTCLSVLKNWISNREKRPFR